jgi:hypothetical protein
VRVAVGEIVGAQVRDRTLVTALALTDAGSGFDELARTSGPLVLDRHASSSVSLLDVLPVLERALLELVEPAFDDPVVRPGQRGSRDGCERSEQP